VPPTFAFSIALTLALSLREREESWRERGTVA